MSKDELDAVTRIAITRAMAAAGQVCREFVHRFPEEEPMIEAIHQRQREDLAMLIPVPEVRQSGK